MMFSGFVAPSRPLFVQLGLLNIYQIYKYQLAIYMYKILLKQVPLLNHQRFSTGSSIHSYDTRFKIDLYKQAHRTNLRQSTICFQGPRLWNNLPESMKLSSSLAIFRKNLKLFLLSEYNCYWSSCYSPLPCPTLNLILLSSLNFGIVSLSWNFFAVLFPYYYLLNLQNIRIFNFALLLKFNAILLHEFVFSLWGFDMLHIGPLKITCV